MEPEVTEAPEKSRLSGRPFELGKPVSRTSDGEETSEEKSPFGVTTVKKGTIESFNIQVPYKSEPETGQEEKPVVESKPDKGAIEFEWGKPLLGASSDEEDYEEEDDSRWKPIVIESAAPVYLEKEPSEVSIPLQRSVRKIVNPEEEVIEEYVDEEGRRVKRISKVTSTKTMTRLERHIPAQEMDVDIPSEPREHVEEYIDEHGQRVRRVVRTSFTTSTKTVLRDGAVKVVLKPGDLGERELREGPEDTERIETFTSDNGRRTQKLTKTTLTTHLKRTVQPVTVEVLSSRSLPAQKDDEPSLGQKEDESINLARVERTVSYPEWLVPVKEKPSTPKEISLASIQVEPDRPVLPTVDDTERPYVVEELSATVVERHRPVISLQDLEDKEESPAIRERKRIEPPEGVSTTPEIPRKRAHKEPSPTPPKQPDSETQMEIEDDQGDDEGDEFDEDIVVVEMKRRPRVPKWFVALPDEPEEPVRAEGLDYPQRITSFVSQVKERPEVTEDVSCISIERKVTIPDLSSSYDDITGSSLFPAKTDDQTPEGAEEANDDTCTKVFESAAPVYLASEDVVPSVKTREVVLPEWMEEIEPTSEEPRQPTGDMSFSILPSGPIKPEPKDDFDREEVREGVTVTTLNRQIVIPEVDGMEGGSPEEIEEYVDENGIRVRRIVRRTITTTTLKREGQQIQPVEVKFPVAQSEDESPEEVEEYVDENGVRVRRIVRRTITTTTIKREGQRIEPVQVKLSVAQSEDESPEEVEEYIDENGERVRRLVRRTITTRSVIRTSVDGAQDDPRRKVFESAAPVCLDSENVIPSVQTREVVLPEWMEESKPTSEEPRQPTGDISFLILPSRSTKPEPKDDVMESVTATTLNRQIVIPEIDGMEDVSPEEVEMYVDEHGVRVRRIVRRKITATSIKREAQQIEPVEVKFPVAQSTEDESPEEVEEYVDENGVRVRRIVRRTITSTTIKREGQQIEPVEVEFPVVPSEDESPEEVEEYIDENGVRVRRIVRRTITTRSVIRTVDETKDDPYRKVFESAAPVYLDSEDVVPSVQTREVVLLEWMEESEPTSDEPRKPQGDISFFIQPVQPTEPESKEDRDRQDVMESVTATTLNREIVIPEIDGMGDELPEDVEEYVDEHGVRVRRIVRRTITTSIKREGQQIEPVEVKFPVAQSAEDESPEEVEEYVDENGVRVRRIVRRTITTTTIKREGQRIEPVEVEFPVVPSEDESPEEVEEYIDENGVRVRRIVRRTITTRSVIRTVDETKDDPYRKVFESAAPVYLDSEDVVPSVQTREVVLPEWMEESEPTSDEPRKPQGDISFFIQPVQPTEPESKEDRDRQDVMESVTATTLNREIVIPEIDGMGDELPEDVEEYVDEHGVRVRRIVRRTITTSIKREGQQIEPVEVKFPVAQSAEDESPEEVEEYVDENGVRVRRIVRRTITTTTIKREGQRIEPVEVEFPVVPSEDESPEEVEEYIDENGVRVRRIVRRTITTRSVIRTVDETKDDPYRKVFESAAPVYLDSEDVVPSVQTREVVLPEWMEESEPTSDEPRKPQGDISFFIPPTQPTEPESKEDRDRQDVMESVTATTLNREIVIPEIDGMGDELPEDVEEYVDEYGVRVKRVVKRTITTTTINRHGHELEPITVEFPVEEREGSSPDEYVEEYVDENGVTVKRIVKRTTTRTVQQRVVFESGVVESGMPVGIYKVTEEVAPSEETATAEAIKPEIVLFSQTQVTSPRRESIPYETTVVQRYLVIIETLYQYVLEHKSMIFIYSSRHMQFNFVLENFLQWMLVTLKKLSWMRPVSWKEDEIKSQLQQIKVFLSHGVCVDLHDGSQCR